MQQLQLDEIVSQLGKGASHEEIITVLRNVEPLAAGFYIIFDTKIGGAGMIMAIAGAAVLTQIQGIVSDQSGSIKLAFWVPAIAFMVIAYYSAVVSGEK